MRDHRQRRAHVVRQRGRHLVPQIFVDLRERAHRLAHGGIDRRVDDAPVVVVQDHPALGHDPNRLAQDLVFVDHLVGAERRHAGALGPVHACRIVAARSLRARMVGAQGFGDIVEKRRQRVGQHGPQ
jgi:hypothetical protein